MKKIMKKIREEIKNNSFKYILAIMFFFIASFSCIKIIDAASEITLNLVEETEDFIKFTWTGVKSISSFKCIKFYVAKEDGDFKEYATINSNKIDYYLMDRPRPTEEDSGIRNYKIVVETSTSKSYESNIKTYDPQKLNMTPSVPELIKEDLRVNEDGSLFISWKPFEYNDGNDKVAVLNPERIKYEMIVTKDIAVLANYDIELTKDTNNEELYNITPQLEMDNGPYWYTTANSSLTRTWNAAFGAPTYSKEKLETNTVYYIVLRAKMDSNTTTLKSDLAINAFYITTNGVLTVPAVIPKPPLSVVETTTKSVTLTWKNKWVEITDNRKSNSSTVWTNRIWLFKNNAGTWEVYLSLEEAENAGYVEDDLITYDLSSDQYIEAWGVGHLDQYEIDATGGTYILRTLQFDESFNYEITSMKEKDVQDLIKGNGFSDAELLDYIADDRSLVWTNYSSSSLQINGEDITAVYEDNLLENTPYRFFIRAYRIDDNGKKVPATRPSSASGTTKIKQNQDEPTPTVPSLQVVENGDIYTKIKWRYNNELYYEIKYGEVDDINQTESIIITNEMLNSKDAEIEDNYYYVYNLKELYPKTRYYVWINAKQVIGSIESAWSNPLTFKTTEIMPNPIAPPGGIGVASEKDAINDSHITVEWTRSEEDYLLDEYEGKNILKNLSYVCEVANNIKFFDAMELNCGGIDGDIQASGNFIVYNKNEFRAINLRSNTRYYVRIKTRITVRDTKNNRECFIESPWSIIKIFKTTSVDEYDSEYGDIDIPLKDKTETIYDGKLVKINILNDDRVINEMVEQGTFDYTFDFSKEKNIYTDRQIYIPINVLVAMQNRDMNIVINTKDVALSVNAKAFLNLDYQNLKRQGGVKGLIMTFNDDDSVYSNSIYAKDIGAYFVTKYGDMATTALEDYMSVLFNTENALYTSKNKPIGMVYNSKTRQFEKAKNTQTLGTNLIVKTGKTGKVGISY